MRAVGVANADVVSRDVSSRTIFKDIKNLIRVHLNRSLQLISGKREEGTVECPQRSPYESPQLRKVTLEQARLLVLGHTGLTDSAMCDFDRILFQQSNSIPDKRAITESTTSGGSVPGETSGVDHPEEGGSTPTPPPQI